VRRRRPRDFAPFFHRDGERLAFADSFDPELWAHGRTAEDWTYALLLGFCLVYLGEHYVADLLAGGALALGVVGAEPLVEPLARRIDDLWRRVEP